MSMSLSELATILDADIVIRQYPNQPDRWVADIHGAETIDGPMLCSKYGNGQTPDEALAAYAEEIRGQRLVVHAAHKELRKEVTVPRTLVVRD